MISDSETQGGREEKRENVKLILLDVKLFLAQEGTGSTRGGTAGDLISRQCVNNPYQ
jgi:hypothetical protein